RTALYSAIAIICCHLLFFTTRPPPPTSTLFPYTTLFRSTELLIQNSLEELSQGRTTIVVAHRLSTIKNADEIIVITNKGIEEKGNHEKLLSENGIYADLYQSQFKNVG